MIKLDMVNIKGLMFGSQFYKNIFVFQNERRFLIDKNNVMFAICYVKVFTAIFKVVAS